MSRLKLLTHTCREPRQLSRYCDQVTECTAKELCSILGAAERDFSFLRNLCPALGPTLTRMRWVTWASSPGVKPTESEIDLLLPSSAKVKKEWSCVSTPPYDIMACTDTALPLHYFYPYCTKTCFNEVRQTLEASA